MFGHFRLLPFIAGIDVGILIFSVYTPNKQVIRQYPHPSESDKKVFKDPNGTCYKYTSHEVNCDVNEGTLRDYPVQG